MTTGRRSVNIYDYPEHLNPFFEDDNHGKLRFWSVTKPKTRSNSFSFQSIKDFKSTLTRRASRLSGTSSSLHEISRNRTEKKVEPQKNGSAFLKFPSLRKLSRTLSTRSKTKNSSSVSRSSQSIENEEERPRFSPSNRHTVQQVSVTPLPRTRFHERVKNAEPAKHDSLDARTPSPDKNPFTDDVKDVEPKPKTPPRKKKRAPPPPPVRQSSLTYMAIANDNSNNIQIEKEPEKIPAEETKLASEDTPSIEDSIANDNHEDSEIIFNSELTISSSETSISSETKLEQRHHELTREDSSDLLLMVQKLQMEVEKLTDDTNNNVISSTCDHSASDTYENCDSKDGDLDSILNSTQTSPIRVRTEINTVLEPGHIDDDDDVVIPITPTSPKLVRLKNDSDWIKS